MKYEWIFLRDYSSRKGHEKSLGDFVRFFNEECMHQSLAYQTPDEVYNAGIFADSVCKKDKIVA